ncbi:hypothetical protein KIN34_16045 [Cellulomonas sp. DKR-3]|uniref:Secreted protein n=1 Tax=Cellulomonas fulva TaxID=2835530 RepID=A0ABS5U315_9CELL|nr:hypothetical protein [Cellulomonas fulva]MBT0995791.1 hypothetical protein [Cellulomonas fulva]
MRFRTRGRALLGGAVTIGALLAAGLGPAAGAEPEPGGTRAASGVSVSSTGGAAGPGAVDPGDVRVARDRTGSTVSWIPSRPVGFGDARVEFRAGDELLGVPVPVGPAYVLRVPGRSDVQAQDVTVTLGTRVLAGPDSPAAAPSARTSVPPVEDVLPRDPGTRGTYSTTSWEYRLPSVALAGLPAKVEMLGKVVAPTRLVGDRPVVLFLHGRHTTCYQKGSDGLSIDWPCPSGWSAIPSHRGYAQAQQLLASQGYVTVSISANGVNGQDDALLDAGADARAALVRRHLDVLADWDAGRGDGPAQRTALTGHLAMRRVMTVGHSRGGEGVQRAALQTQAGDRFTIAGQVLVAPTDFGQQVAVGVPTTVLLPYCDGDVSDLQGQMVVDQGARVAAGDRATRSAVLVMGANHNYFNSEWTPGSAAAPAWDDWWNASDAVCGDEAPQRLSAAQQRAVGATYVAAAARTYLTSDTSALPLLDGTAVRAPSAGTAVVLSHAVGGRRSTLVVPGERGTLTGRGGMTVTPCVGARTPGSELARCGRDLGSPHWTPQSWSWAGPAGELVRLSWTAKGATATLPVTTDLRYRSHLDLRLVAPPQSTTPSVEVVFRDRRGRAVAARPVRQAVPLPTHESGHEWAQNVRVPIPAGVDRAALTSISLRSTSSTGTLLLLDASAAARGLASSTATVRSLPRIAVPATTTIDATGSGDETVTVRVPVTGTVRAPAIVELMAADSSGRAQLHRVTLRPGQRALEVPVSYAGDDAYADDASGVPAYVVAVRAVRNVSVDDYIGDVQVRSGVPRPTFSVEAAAASAGPGESLTWRLRLSGPTTQEVYVPIRAVVPDGAELTVGDLLPGWAAANLPAVLPASTPLSESGLRLLVAVPAYATSVLVEVPIRQGITFTGSRTVELVASTKQFGPRSLTLAGTVTRPGS